MHFVEFTPHSGGSVMVNLDCIACVQPTPNGEETLVMLCNGTQRIMSDKYEDVQKIIQWHSTHIVDQNIWQVTSKKG